MWKNIVQPERQQMTVWRMRISPWMPKATHTHTHTHTHRTRTHTHIHTQHTHTTHAHTHNTHTQHTHTHNTHTTHTQNMYSYWFFHCNSGSTNALHCYVVRILPVSFFCGLFCDAAVTPNYVVCIESNGRMTGKWWFVTDVTGRGCDVIEALYHHAVVT